MNTIYNQIGINYSTNRQTDPGIAQQIHNKLEGAKKIVNIGAGTGSYEPESIALTAVEPSLEMISQRTPDSHKVVQASAEKLPFEDKSFTHAMTVLSMHHWKDRAAAFQEINRVTSEKFVAITWNPDAKPFWLTKDYFPEIHKMDRRIFPTVDEFYEYFDEVDVTPLLIPEDCKDGFLAAFWKRPEAYLEKEVRQSISAFAKIGDCSKGLQKLKSDLESGGWANRNKDILSTSLLDAGYMLISARIKNTTKLYA